MDFDVVPLDGRLLVVGSPDHGRLACAWDPEADRWTEYRLDEAETGRDHIELTALAATVVDGRIVIGGGGEHQGFAAWELETGTLRVSEQEGGVNSATCADVDGRPMFVVAGSSSTDVRLWDPSVVEQYEDESLPHPYDVLVETELYGCSAACSGVAAGTVDGRSVLVANVHEGGVCVWDIGAGGPLVEFGDESEGRLTDFGLASVNGRARLVAAGERNLLTGDPRTGAWDEPLPLPDVQLMCLDTHSATGRWVAVAGFEDGMIRAWDLDQRRMLGEPFGEPVNRNYHADNRVHAIRIADLDGRLVVISAHNDDLVRVWELPR